ncbi:PAS domain S-box-containing protein [Rhodoligotrophos appendicifer]|uniref:ATP-binding protein n=1 Tax=Rhodoligotrophos appendicifer TaxID=987056 RepID=UPI001186F4EE|nr:ATP-binding protein [Rhodoligotrophos appendicifer]
MTRGGRANLEALSEATQPAWLWDGQRARIVWANAAAIAFFGGHSLFDLIDLRFEPREPSVQRLAALLDSLAPGREQDEILRFAAGVTGQPIACRCHYHRLADGRPGILVVGLAEPEPVHDPSAPADAVMDALPQAVMIFDGEGGLLRANRPAMDLFPGARRRDLAALFDEERSATRFLERVMSAGIAGEVRALDTTFGMRDIRLEARKLEAVGAEPQLMLVLEDVAERRALQRQLEDNAARLTDFVAASADFTFELDPELRWISVSGGFAEATGTAAGDVLGLTWEEAARRFGYDVQGTLHGAMEQGQAWRAIVEWQGPVGPSTLCLSAVAVAGGRGYRGIGAVARSQRGVPAERSADQPAAQSAVVEEPVAAPAAALNEAPVQPTASAQSIAEPALLDASESTAADPEAPLRTSALAAGSAERRQLSEADAAAFERIARSLGTVARDISAVRPAGSTTTPQESASDRVVQAAQALVDSIDQPSLIHREGRVLAANAGAAQVFSHDSVEALLAIGLDGLLPGWRVRGEEACVSTDDGRVAPHSITAKTLDLPDGQVRQLIFTPRSAPLPEREAGSEGWTPKDDTLRAILETATDGILMLERDGCIRSFNAGAQAIFGCEPSAAVGRPFAEFLSAESRKTFKDYLDVMTEGTLSPIFNDGREITGVERQGGEIPLFLTITPVAEGHGFCAVLRDITHWKKAESDLRAAKDEAERTSAQKSEFLANISHELRTPLNAILGFSEVMKSERFGAIRNEKYLGYIGDIHASGEHLLSLINDLLDLSKVEAGKLELNFTAVNLVDVVDQVVHIMQDQAREARVLMRTSIPADLPFVVADQRSMRQIILNLLSNAVKFTEPGGQVIVSLVMTPEGEVKLRVKDTGIGMTEEELVDALQPFRRIETKRRSSGGTGLGLPLTKALTEANRAGFTISSRPESGTMVEITFPTTRVLAE